MSNIGVSVPPVAEEKTHYFKKFGRKWNDPYSWMRERNSAKVLAHLAAENAYAKSYLAPLESFQEKLYAEMLSHVKESDESVPKPMDEFFYYSRTVAGKNYRLFCRKKGSLNAPEQVMLDVNELALGKKFMSLGFVRVSPNHRLLAYSKDTEGNESFTLVIKDLETNQELSEHIEGLAYSFAWAADSKTFFYTTLDEAHRAYRIFRHTLGQDSRQDPLLYEEKDERFDLEIQRSRDQKKIFFISESKRTNEVWMVDADRANEEPSLFWKRKDEIKIAPEYQDGKFYILSNEGQKNFQVFETLESEPKRKNWKIFIKGRSTVFLESIETFAGRLVVSERFDARVALQIYDLKTKKSKEVKFPETLFDFNLSESAGLRVNSPFLRIEYESFLTPTTVYDYDFKTGTLKVKKQTEVPGGFDPQNYESRRIYAKGKDGTRIPLSLFYRRGLFEKDGTHPGLLSAYGSYGASREISFNSNRLILADRGVLFAIAHIRGGGDNGKAWHEEGRMLKKKNTFKDFIACSEYLIKSKWVSPEGLLIKGGSAGGLLMGAVINERPELFKAVLAQVPFVDVLNTMLDPKLPLTVTEYEEWGNPDQKKYFDMIRSYAPYENVKIQSYPAMLVTAGLNDTRVSYWEPAKWVARLRKKKIDENPLLFETKMEAGHAGVSGRYEYLKDEAKEIAFLLSQVGITD